MASEMVMAYGTNGLELTPVEETIEIESIPLGEGNKVTPATVQWFSGLPCGGHVPLRLLKVRFPTKKNGRKYAAIDFACTPFQRGHDNSGRAVYGEWATCCIRNLADAGHPIFAGLSERDRARLARAGKAAERAR